MTKRTQAEQALLDRQAREHSKTEPVQIKQWVVHTHQCAEEVATKGNNASHGVVAIFWIRIFGILHDIDKHLSKPRPAHAATFAAMRARIAELRKLYTDDELLWLEYRRNVDAHPFQHSYRPVNSDGSERKEVPSKLLPGLTPVDVDQRLGKLIRMYGRKERAIAADFAKRAYGPALGKLIMLASKYEVDTMPERV